MQAWHYYRKFMGRDNWKVKFLVSIWHLFFREDFADKGGYASGTPSGPIRYVPGDDYEW